MGRPRRPGPAHRHAWNRTTYARWAAPENSQPFTDIARAALRELQASGTTLGEQTGVRA
jgi:hypothetical protein